MAEQQANLALTCYRIHKMPSMPIVPASSQRDWMDRTNDRFAYRCLPLLMANQNGWCIINKHQVRVIWNGKDKKEDLSVTCLSGPDGFPCPAVSHFGSGIVTWHLNYLFRTSPGYNLWVKGPSNWPKLGITALEGTIETDWAVATFTMNWKMTSIDFPVYFEPEEPICMFVPIRRGEAEAFAPAFREISQEPQLSRAYEAWSASRAAFNNDLTVRGSQAQAQKWQKDYFVGESVQGAAPSQHQVKLNLKDFGEMPPTA
jgi:Family of unknown function (DUF6065)